MKQYICLNHGECNWADETPPREFPLPDGDDHFCPNCESVNIKESLKPSNIPWTKMAMVAGVVLLIAGFVWLFWPKPEPLTLKVVSNCQKGLITLTTSGGDESPITYSAEGLKSTKEDNVFKIPVNQRNGSTLTFHASQNGQIADNQYKTDCPLPRPPYPPTVGGGGKSPANSVKWTRVPGSEFCDDLTECVQVYSEENSLGQIRERKIKNCADCGAAKK